MGVSVSNQVTQILSASGDVFRALLRSARSKPSNQLVPAEDGSRRSYQTDLPNAPYATERPHLRPPAGDVRTKMRELRAHSRQEVQRGTLGSSILRAMQRNVLSAKGIMLRSRHRDPFSKALLERSWKAWGKTCGFGGDTWRDIERQVLRSLIVDGEAFVRFVAVDGALRLRCIDPHRIDPTFYAVRGDNAIRMGIEYDPAGDVVAYWLTDPPVVLGAWSAETYQDGAYPNIRLPAAQVLHIYDRSTVAVGRGIPWLAPTTVAVELLRHFADAVKVASLTGANMYAIAKKLGEGGSMPFTDKDRKDLSENTRLKPGGIFVMPEDWDVEVVTPTQPTAAYEPFTKAAHSEIASAVGIATHTLTGDLSGINFSAGRIGALSERETFSIVRQMIIDGLHEKAFDDWLQIAYAAGMPGEMDAYRDVVFVGKAFEHIQPREQANAYKTYVEMGVMSPSEVIRDRGEDPDDVFTEIGKDKKRLESMGLPYPTSSPNSGEDDATETDESPSPFTSVVPMEKA